MAGAAYFVGTLSRSQTAIPLETHRGPVLGESAGPLMLLSATGQGVPRRYVAGWGPPDVGNGKLYFFDFFPQLVAIFAAKLFGLPF